jgi:carboxylesterase
MAGVPPFELGDPGAQVGAVVLHGFSGSPHEVRPLGEALAARGLHVLGPALAGHENGDPRDLGSTEWSDWYATLERTFAAQCRRHRQVVVVGFSMGGLLALHLAAQRPAQLAALGAIGVPLWLPAAQTHLIVALGRVLARLGRLPFSGHLIERALVPKQHGQSDLRDPEARRLNPTMPAMPLLGLFELVKLAAVVRGELEQVEVPTFVAHGGQDHTAPPACADELERRVVGAVTRLRLPESFHLVPLDVERERLADGLGRFVEQILEQTLTV